MRALRLLLLALCCAAPAWAQQPQEDKLSIPDLSQYRRWGFLRARPGVELSNFGYDSNILFNNTGATVSDITATLSPKLDGLILLGSRGFLTFEEQFDYTLYLENGDQNFWNNSLSTRATIPFKGFGFFGEWDFEDVRLRPLDQQDTRAESKRREIGGGMILQPGWRTEIEVAVYTDKYRLKDEEGTPIGTRLNRNETRTDLEVSYQLRGRTRGLLELERKRVDFLAPFDTGTTLVERDTRELRWRTGLELGRGGPLQGRLLLGWATINAQDPILEDFSEMIGELDVTWLAGSRSRVRFEAERRTGFAVSEGNAYFLDTFGAVRFIHYFTTIIGGEASYRRGTLDFPRATIGITREDEIERMELGIRLRLFRGADGRRIEYSATFGRFRRDSNLPGFDQDQNTFSLGAVLGF